MQLADVFFGTTTSCGSLSLPVAGEQQVWLEDLSTTTCYSTPANMVFSQSLFAARFHAFPMNYHFS
jgi:hypothetical protein